MKARLIINEIKQNRSGLGSIRVGSAVMTDAYKNIKNIQPDIAKIKPMSSTIYSWNHNDDRYHFLLETIPQILGAPLSNIKRLGWSQMSIDTQKYLESILMKDDKDIRHESIELQWHDEDGTVKKEYVKFMINDEKGVAVLQYTDTQFNTPHTYYLIKIP